MAETLHQGEIEPEVIAPEVPIQSEIPASVPPVLSEQGPSFEPVTSEQASGQKATSIEQPMPSNPNQSGGFDRVPNAENEIEIQDKMTGIFERTANPDV